MAAKFILVTHIKFWITLAIICGSYYFYYEPLRAASHAPMVAMQVGNTVADNPPKVQFGEKLETYTNTEQYFLACFMFYPFMCRQRFFYYLFGFIYCDVLKNIIKLGYHMPRPLWLWSDIQCYAAEKTLSSPSGHTTRATFLTAFIFLDLFFASNYSRQTNPNTNSRSLSRNKLLAGTILGLGITYFITLVYFVFFMGQHSFD